MKHGTQIYAAARELLRLNDIKQKIKLKTATPEEIEDYNANKPGAWRQIREEVFGLQESTLARLKPGEPAVLLRAQDQTAAGLLYQWENRARKHGTPEAKCKEMHEIAVAFEAWPNRKHPD